MLDYLSGAPLPPLPDLPGQVYQCHDEPLAEDDLAGIESATELARLLGVSRQRAHHLIQQRAAKAHPATEGTEP